MSMHLAILRAVGLLVPPDQRLEWFAEWQSELWYVRRSAEGRATAFCFGALRDALWLRRNSLPSQVPPPLLASPYHCIAVMAVVAAALAAIAVFFPFRWPAPPPGAAPTSAAEIVWGNVLLVSIMACAILCASAIQRGLELLGTARDQPFVFLDLRQPASLRLTGSKANRYAPRGAARLGRWVFLAVKSALLILITVCGLLDLGPGGGIGLVFSCTVVFRWAVADQRQRCPVCLRRVINPTRIGEASHMFLDWYGTEFMCAKGHGLLHVPEIPTSCYSTQRWLYLDPSWSSLFSPELSAHTSV